MWVLLAPGLSPAQEQEAGSVPLSRAETIRQQRQQRAAAIPPTDPSPLPAEPKKERFDPTALFSSSNGWGVRIGQVAPGQGFALGPKYQRRELFGGRLRFRGEMGLSTSKAWDVRADLEAPSLFKKRVFGEADVFHLHGPHFEYYGRGSESRLVDHSTYRLEQNGIETRLGYRVSRHLRFGVLGGLLQSNPGPGTRPGVPQTADVFTPEQLPAVDVTTRMWTSGVFASFDSRDDAGGPRAGGLYQIRLENYADANSDIYGFRRLRFEAQQYIPFWNKTNVVALRLNSTITYTGVGHDVPFYLQPALGGSREMRGFPRFRFTDRNALIAQAEYRWRLFSGMDAVGFFDAGKVTVDPGDLDFNSLEASTGAGLRLKLQGNTFMRVEVAFSHEGSQLWIRFGDIFQGLW